MNCVTVDEYVTVEEDLTTCFTFDGASEANWSENLRTTAVSDCGSAAKRPALEQVLRHHTCLTHRRSLNAGHTVVHFR